MIANPQERLAVLRFCFRLAVLRICSGGFIIRRNRGMPELKVKSGEEWVKSARTLFTPRNADKHRGFGPKGEE